MKLFLVILQMSLVLSAKFLAKEEDVSGFNELNEAPVDATDAEEVKLEMARMKEVGRLGWEAGGRKFYVSPW